MKRVNTLPADNLTKICWNCKKEKPVSEFYKSNTRYYQRECKDCCKAGRSMWWKSEKGKLSSANTKLKRRFGMTLEEYIHLLNKCGGKCEICGAEMSSNNHRLGIDHNHITGEIRGILCNACNVGIANLKEDMSILESAIKYLTRNGNGKK